MDTVLIVRWGLIVFGALTFLPLLISQLILLCNPNGQKAKNLIIGKGEDWRDKTHYKSAMALAWADWAVIFPLFILGNIGVVMNVYWGYIIWICLGILSIYFSIVFWVLEKEYTYPSCGWIAYYTYYWGFFLYWGILAAAYSLIQILL